MAASAQPSSHSTRAVVASSLIAGGVVLYELWRKYAAIPSKQWLRACPKMELHAHLHGSIRMQTLAELYETTCADDEEPQTQIRNILKKHKSFNEVFALFDVIHRVVSSKAALQRILDEVLLDFAHQNVRFLIADPTC